MYYLKKQKEDRAGDTTQHTQRATPNKHTKSKEKKQSRGTGNVKQYENVKYERHTGQ